MMLEHLGEQQAASAVVSAIEAVLRQKEFCTPDLGGSSTTAVMGEAVADSLERTV
jgi:tartrate dehydrogenase/decarboxylase/D-malate dehydrogenase